MCSATLLKCSCYSFLFLLVAQFHTPTCLPVNEQLPLAKVQFCLFDCNLNSFISNRRVRPALVVLVRFYPMQTVNVFFKIWICCVRQFFLIIKQELQTSLLASTWGATVRVLSQGFLQPTTRLFDVGPGPDFTQLQRGKKFADDLLFSIKLHPYISMFQLGEAAHAPSMQFYHTFLSHSQVE